MNTAVMCLTADPIHHGHLHVVGKALDAAFDKIIVGIAADTSKKTLFTVDERLKLASEAFKEWGKAVEVKKYEGTTVDFLTQQKARVMIRGIRSGDDFQYEADLAWANRQLSKTRFGTEIETIFILAGVEKTHISSTLIKSYAHVGCSEEELAAYVPDHVARALVEKCRQ